MFLEKIAKDTNLQEQLETAGHKRRRAAFAEMQAENDLEAAKAAMSRDDKIKRSNVGPGETSKIHLDVKD